MKGINTYPQQWLQNRKSSLLLSCCCGLMLCVSSCTESVKNPAQESSLPTIFPDYVGVTIPSNIAPLNFCMEDEDALLVDAVITDKNGRQLHGQGAETTDFDIADWQTMLAQNVGDSICVSVSAKLTDGWHTYRSFSIYVSADKMDYGVAYRKLEPGYEVYSKMGIYERNLSTFEETTLIENTQFQGCVNCHSFNRGNPEDMSLHIRGEHGATLLRYHGQMEAYNTATSQTLGSCVYPYWHPGGRYIAYSTNTTRQVFHASDANRIEVFDSASDLLVYDCETNELITTPILEGDSVMETFPAFSADGRTLYFCQATSLPENSLALDSIHYNICSITFNPEDGTFGNEIDTIVDAVSMNRTATMPRPSYDGRYLLFTMADYGQFPIWHHEADLYMIPIEELNLAKETHQNIKDIEAYRMSIINSEETESFHNWSSNSRWIVFSSRCIDGLFTRLFFTHIDEDGKESKPFLMPQQNPRRYYDNLFMSYNVPDFITSPVKFDNLHAEEIINAPERKQMKVRQVQ